MNLRDVRRVLVASLAAILSTAGCQLTITSAPKQPHYSAPAQEWNQPAWPPLRESPRY